MTNEDVLDAWPGVRIDNDNLAYYRGLLDQVLMMNRCDDCANWHHPPRSVCPKCWSRDLTPTEVRGDGSVAMVTVLRQGSPRPGVDYTDGHALVAIELDEQAGLRIAGTVVGTAADEIAVGDRVRMVWRTIEGREPRPDFEVVR